MLHDILRYGFAGAGVLCIAAAALSRPRRGVFIWAALAALFTAVSAHYHIFWATIVFGLMVPWALFCALPTIDFTWRAKTGFVFYLLFGSLIAVYPTYHDERWGRNEDRHLAGDEQAQRLAKAAKGQLGVRRWLLANIPFRLVRGLDLKGGLRLVYVVDVDEAIKDERDRRFDDFRMALARSFGFATEETVTNDQLKKLNDKLRTQTSKDQVNTFTAVFNDAADAAKVDDALLEQAFGKDHRNVVQVQRSGDGKTVSFRIRSEFETFTRDDAVKRAKETINRRVDNLGLKEASVTVRNENIIVEVPGEDEKAFDEIKDIISKTARLEFKMVDDETDYFQSIAQTARREDLPNGLEFGVENAPVGPGKTKPTTYAFMRRVEGEDMPSALKRLQEWLATLQVESDHEIGFGKVSDYDEEKAAFTDVGWRTYYLFSRAEITGNRITEAQARFDEGDKSLGNWYVAIEFDQEGARAFEEITGRSVKKRFAIILDDKVESAPVIQQKIGGGRASITLGAGNMEQQLEDARKLELVLRSGALAAPIALDYDQRIGPSLGRDAINEAGKGGALGALLVLVFMVVYYSRAGMIANIAVIFNMLLQIAVLAMFGASMTLPGIAGLTLTIGVAVDANVLINERIRDELRAGKSPRAAVDVGYDKAFSAILDGHVTTLISGLILAQYGSGPIKGFAITLIVGIAVSLFTGVVCTRLMFDWAVRGRKVKKLHLG